jgi:hypothetical protein
MYDICIRVSPGNIINADAVTDPFEFKTKLLDEISINPLLPLIYDVAGFPKKKLLVATYISSSAVEYLK